MSNRERYWQLLEGIRDAHSEHARAYQTARSKFGTNRKAHEATEAELQELKRRVEFFYRMILHPLQEPFLAGHSPAIDEIVTFLEVDVAAFRSGYSKEWYYRKLKALKLNATQVERLQEIALKRCASLEYRREDSELRRLMIRLADSEFVQRVRALPDSPNVRVQRKKTPMLEVILRGRKDLREQQKRGLGLGKQPDQHFDFLAVRQIDILEEIQHAAAETRAKPARLGFGGARFGL